jgi:GNAT superfamily N-acetyltransferase
MTSSTPVPAPAVSTSTARDAADIVLLRAGGSADVPFILSSWLKCYRQSPAVSAIRTDRYFRRHHAVLERLLARPTARVTIAAYRDDPDTIFGWAVTEGDVLHFLYVKDKFRAQGIGRRLLAQLPPRFTYSHRLASLTMDRLLRHYPGAEFDPYALTEPTP